MFFRASTRDQALALGLQGHARNLPNGDVEVIAAGDARAIDSLQTWLWRGPAQARVDNVQVEVIQPEFEMRGFTIA